MTTAAPRIRDELRPLRECVVLVTPRSFGMHDRRLRAELEARVGEARYHAGPLSAEELAPLLGDADGLLAGLDEITGAVLERAPRLRVVARYGVGLDRVDVDAAARHGVIVTVTPGANANAVAELTIAFLFALARPLAQGRDRARAGAWTALPGVELARKTLGLVGLGRIGSLVAKKASALGLDVVAHDPYVDEHEHAQLVSLDTLLAEADFVSLHAPLTDETRGIVDASFFARMKEGAVLVNTARGDLVDEDALLGALESGRLTGAALDVLAQEPPPPGHPLLARDDVLVTPHIGPHTAEATTAMGRLALDDLLAVLDGRVPRYRA